MYPLLCPYPCNNHQALESRFFDGTLDDMYDVCLGVVSEDVDDVKRAKATPLLCLPPLGDQVSIN